MATQGSRLSVVQDVFRSGDRRRSVRQKVHSPAYASFTGIGGGIVLDLTEITNISEAGIGLESSSGLDANRALNLVLDLSETKTYIHGTGYVVWSDASGRAGIRFSKMPDATRLQLKEWLFFNAMAGAAKAAESQPEPDSMNSTPEILTPQNYDFNPVSSGALAAMLKPTVRVGPSLVIADAPTLNAIQEQVDALGADTLAAFQLLAERAQTITRAAGAAIALAESTEMVCRASSGEAPPIGARFQAGSGFSGECVRTGKLQRCDDSEFHPIVDRESCRRLGIRSMIAVPVASGHKVIGLLEVFSPHPFAFEETDATALRRISDIVARVAEKQNRNLDRLAELATTPHTDDLELQTVAPPDTRKKWLFISAASLAIIGVLTVGLYFFLRRSPMRPLPAASAPHATAGAPDLGSLESLRNNATQGDPVAQFALGARYSQGDGVKQDYGEAVRWFSKAADQGHVVAQATLGAYYWAGRGVPQDLEKAYFWSALARAGGDEASKYRIAALTSRMTHAQVAAGQREAEEWLRQHQIPDRAGR